MSSAAVGGSGGRVLLRSMSLRGRRPGQGQGGGVLLRRSRSLVTTTSGAYLPEPKRASFVLTGVFGTVSAGLLVGALVSKNIASFLEENELFIPSDDDGDD